ncbi:MAG: PIN domain-containing protein [Elusimicrobia bacterium]|nr:PIN domain-containing protein [Elusimicrobiota bacterium]
MAKNYLLDTSAIFVYTKSEEGSNKIEYLLSLGEKGTHTIYLSLISLMEIYYITWQSKNESLAKELIALVKALPLQLVELNEKIVLAAGRIKANHRLSVADAIIAATAIEKDAVLVHKDPEFESISEYIEILTLPYKTTKKDAPDHNLTRRS